MRKVNGRAAYAPVFGNMTGTQFALSYASKISGSNTWTGNTPFHLINALKEYYTISHECKQYIGLTIDWDYEKQEIHISIPGYIEDALTRFKHYRPRAPQDQPQTHIPPNYGATRQ